MTLSAKREGSGLVSGLGNSGGGIHRPRLRLDQEARGARMIQRIGRRSLVPATVEHERAPRGELATIATYGCLPEQQMLTSGQMIPGSQYTGMIILDVPEPNGTLIYRPSSLMEGGWEWVF